MQEEKASSPEVCGWPEEEASSPEVCGWQEEEEGNTVLG